MNFWLATKENINKIMALITFKRVIVLYLIKVGITFLIFFLLGFEPAGAYGSISADITQVKTPDSPVVYYLNHVLGAKKAYINEASFLSYGLSWSDVAIVPAAELNIWPDVRLVKRADSPDVYYIKDGKKTLIKSENDFIKFNFKWNEIVAVNVVDLAQYQTVGYEEAGFEAKNVLNVYFSGRISAANMAVANTKDNLLAELVLKSDRGHITVKNLSFKLKGLFNINLISGLRLADETGNIYKGRLAKDERNAYFYFESPALNIRSGEERRLKVYADFFDRPGGGDFYLSLESPDAISANADPVGMFPIYSGASYFSGDTSGSLGRVSMEEQPLAQTAGAAAPKANAVLARFKISETSKNEDVFLDELVFENAAGRGANLKNFKLKNGLYRVVAETENFESGNLIKFDLSGYKIKKGTSENFIVAADVAPDAGDINIDFKEAKMTGGFFGYSLNSSSFNLDAGTKVSRKPMTAAAVSFSDNNQVFSERTGAVIGNFSFRNNGSTAVRLDSVDAELIKNVSAPDLNAKIYVIDYRTGEEISVIDSGNLAGGRINLGGRELKPYKDLAATLIIADLPEGSVSDDYSVRITGLHYNDIENGRSYSDVVDISCR